MKFFQIILLISPCFSSNLDQKPLSSYEILFKWTQIQFDSNENSRSRYIPENNVISGIGVDSNPGDKNPRLFLTLPRWREGVSATLATIHDLPNSASPTSPKLQPFPNWEMQLLGDCAALQNALALQIDQFHRLWVVDIGRSNTFGSSNNFCPPKIIIFDLNSDSNPILRSHIFPRRVVNWENNYLSDLSLACITEEECSGVLVDTQSNKLVIYSFQKDNSWFYTYNPSFMDSFSNKITILGDDFTIGKTRNKISIALSPLSTNFSTLYISPLTSYGLYSLPTTTLFLPPTITNDLEDSEFTRIGSKASQSEGMTVDSKGHLFYGLLGENGIGLWPISYSHLNSTNAQLLVQSDIDLQWPTGFALDHGGYLYTISNRFFRFHEGNYDPKEHNFRLIRVYIGAKSHLYPNKD